MKYREDCFTRVDYGVICPVIVGYGYVIEKWDNYEEGVTEYLVGRYSGAKDDFLSRDIGGVEISYDKAKAYEEITLRTLDEAKAYAIYRWKRNNGTIDEWHS